MDKLKKMMEANEKNARQENDTPSIKQNEDLQDAYHKLQEERHLQEAKILSLEHQLSQKHSQVSFGKQEPMNA